MIVGPGNEDQQFQASLALGLRSTAQCLGRLGIEFGVFAGLDIDLKIAASETAAPAALAGLIADDWAFAEIGAVPVVSGVLEGHDPVILLAPEPVSALFVMGRKDISEPSMLEGGRIAVLSETGQTGVSAHAMLRRWELEDDVTLVALGKYPAIFDALATGDLQAGLLPADYRFTGEKRHGLVALADLGETFGYQGPVVATTRRFISNRPDFVAKVVQGYVDAIGLFKTERARLLPFLADHLGFEDPDALTAIYEFYAPRFQSRPYPSGEGIARIISSFQDQFPGAADLAPADVCDLSFLDKILDTRAPARE